MHTLMQGKRGFMLVLSRQKDESIVICDKEDPNIIIAEITIVDVRGDKVRLGINAQKEFPVHREEIYLKIQKEKGQTEQQQNTENAA